MMHTDNVNDIKHVNCCCYSYVIWLSDDNNHKNKKKPLMSNKNKKVIGNKFCIFTFVFKTRSVSEKRRKTIRNR